MTHMDRYRTDPEYRAAVLARNNRSYQRCKARRRAAYQAKRAADPAFVEAQKASSKRNHLRRMGLSFEEYDAMYTAQGGVCAVCSVPKPARSVPGGPKRLYVDHNHSTGKIRALLCQHCNSALGHAADSADRLRDLASYLDRHNDR